jgi:hypothetical protein
LGRGDQQIECDWFYGSVQEAAMEALERNNILKLNISQPDRMEEAWKWVLLEWGSKAEIVKACGVGDGTVGTMRRAVRWVQLLDEKYKPMQPEHKDFNDAVAFRKRLQGGWYESSPNVTVPKDDAAPAEWFDYLTTFTWGIAGRMLKGVTQKEFDAEEASVGSKICSARAVIFGFSDSMVPTAPFSRFTIRIGRRLPCRATHAD